MRKTSCILLAVCLCAFPFLALCESTIEPVVYYNADGGTYYHLKQSCSTMSEAMQQKLSSAPYSILLSGLCSLFPCEECAPVETRNYWYGEAEYRDAWRVLQGELLRQGQRPFAPCGWTITSTKEQISVFVITMDGQLAVCELMQKEGSWRFINFNLVTTPTSP